MFRAHWWFPSHWSDLLFMSTKCIWYCQLFTKLGFTVHPVKSVLQPQWKINFGGFTLDSITMTVTLNESKAIRSNPLVKICASKRQPLFVIGYLVSSFPAVEILQMHYRHLKLDKIWTLLTPLWPCLPHLGQNWLRGKIMYCVPLKLLVIETLTCSPLMYLIWVGELSPEITPLGDFGVLRNKKKQH